MKTSTFSVKRFALWADLPWQDEAYSLVPGAAYWDFVIDGTPRGERLDLVSCLAWYGGSIRQDSVRRLLFEVQPDLPNGRITLYVRYDCDPPYPPLGHYDATSEVISAQVERQGDIVLWRDFIDDLGENVMTQGRRQKAVAWGPYQFDWSEYQRELHSLLEGKDASLTLEKRKP